MLYIQHYIKTVHFQLKYNGLAIVRKATKLIEAGWSPWCSGYVITSTFFNVFYVFFQNPKSRDFLRFLPCFVRFLELCSQPCRGLHSTSAHCLCACLCSFSAVCHHQFSVPVLADVWRRRSRYSHVLRCAVDGSSREEVSADEERQRGTVTASPG